MTLRLSLNTSCYTLVLVFSYMEENWTVRLPKKFPEKDCSFFWEAWLYFFLSSFFSHYLLTSLTCFFPH